MVTCLSFLKCYAIQWNSCLHWVVTGYDTWICHSFLPVSDELWHGYAPSCTRKHKFEVKWSVGKMLTIIFWDSLVVLLVDCLERGHPVNPSISCCAEKLAIGQEKTSQSSKLWCGSPPWQYSAARGAVDLELVANLCWEILDHTAQSGFGARQFSFVSCLEGTLVRASFPSDEDVKHTTNNHVADAYRMDKLSTSHDHLKG